MKFLDSKHKRKSAVITASILVLLLLVMCNYGMKYMDPPIEYGVAINFGNSDNGSGKEAKEVLNHTKSKPVKEVEENPQVEEQIKQTETVEPQPIEEPQTEEQDEQMLVDETPKAQNVPVVKKTLEPKELKKPKKKPLVEPTKKEPVKEVKPVPKPKPKPTVSDNTKKALADLLSGGTKGRSEGDDSKASGVKGKESGDPNASKYYGNAGSGGNYRLAGREALSKPKQNPDCEEEGKVVVEIYVNKLGKVVKADPCKSGTTNSASCLCKAAKEAALQTVWNTDPNAPANQRGKIIYLFSLTK